MLTLFDIIQNVQTRLQTLMPSMTNSILLEPVTRRDFSQQMLEQKYPKGVIFVICPDVRMSSGTEIITISILCVANSHQILMNCMQAVRWGLSYYYFTGLVKRFEFQTENIPEHEDGTLARVLNFTCVIPTAPPSDYMQKIIDLGF